MVFRRILLVLFKGIALLALRIGLRAPYLLASESLVRRTGLFDEAWYRRHNPDVADTGMDPLRHFVRYGDREGRSPLPLFEPGHYRSHVQPRCPQALNSLLHYALIGRAAGASTSAWFDAGHYLQVNRDVKFARMDPLLHFLRFGWREGRTPTPEFNRQQFLAAMPSFDPAAAAESCEPPHAVAPSAEDWNALAPPDAADVHVDVIVPVYRGYSETLRCLHAALRYRQRTPFELIVINDAGPDQELNAELRRLAARGLFTYLENGENLGFVRTVNRGMALHPDRDVVLLNSDAEPFNDWLDRLRAAALARNRVASVTPLSNNATICSYPHFNRDNPQALEVDGETVDRLASRVNAGVSVPAPTGVGFCMYIRRPALDAVGLFDAEAFGQGYGEENDFCQRAIAAGWQNLIAADVYVWHWGSTSFGGTRHARVAHAMEVLQRRYPRYQRDVADFIDEDSLAASRRRLDRARLLASGGSGNVLVITHARGGGTERFVQRSVDALRAEGRGVFFLRPSRDGAAQLSAQGVQAVPNLSRVATDDAAGLAILMSELAIDEVQLHQLVDFASGTAQALCAAVAAGTRRVRLTLFVHDYYAICPRINLVDDGGVYCGEPPPDACNRCLQRSPRIPGLGEPDILGWRARMRGLIEAADAVVVPDEDVMERLRRYFPAAAFRVTPHEQVDTLRQPVSRRPLRAGEALEIVIIGAIGNIKGYEVLAACARDARLRRLPLRFTVMGYSRDDNALRRLGVQVTGRYREEDGVRILSELDPHMVWLPSVWPETYSYTLSLALACDRPVAAFDIGAIAGRLRRGSHPAVLLPAVVRDPQRINRAFLEWAAGQHAPAVAAGEAEAGPGRAS